MYVCVSVCLCVSVCESEATLTNQQAVSHSCELMDCTQLFIPADMRAEDMEPAHSDRHHTHTHTHTHTEQ